MIVATAGHVDHGKTALVRALTGIDTDRLPEEKARGMTIDLGFAYRRLDDGVLLGFVDVPGHERFVRNMVAGACGVDFALLVVAADDGPMPQTREHVAILDLLGVNAGAVAVTKVDRVDDARRRQVEGEIAALLAGTALAGIPVFATSTVTGDGLAALIDHLSAKARQHRRGAAGGRFRLAVDRCFVLRGVGVVATGSVFSGAARVGDALAVAPSGQAVRVRGLRIHDRDVETVSAGDRCAVTLSGIERSGLQRGDWIVAPEACRPTSRIDVRLRQSSGSGLRHWSPAHLHLGAADVPCRIALTRGDTTEAGTSRLATLVLDRPTAAVAGDRFVLRDQSARRTIGGGRVLDPFAPARVADKAARRLWLDACDAADAATAFERLAGMAHDGVDFGWFADAWNITAEEERGLSARGEVTICEVDGIRIAFANASWQALRDRILSALDRHHREFPGQIGLDESALRRTVPAARPAISELIAQGRVHRAGSRVHLAGHRIVPAADELHLWQAIEPALTAGGIRPPRVVELAALSGLERGAIEAFLLRAEELGWVERVARNRFYTPDAVQALGRIAAILAGNAAERGFTAAEFNHAAGIGRNLTIEVLEHLDRIGLTRRVGERRLMAIDRERSA